MATDVRQGTQPQFFTGEDRKLLIGGQWVDAASGEQFDTIDPSTGEKLASCAKGGPEDVDRAYRAAATAFEQWRETTPSERQLALLKLADLVAEHAEELVALETAWRSFGDSSSN